MTVRIGRALASDVDAMLPLIVEHAAFERDRATAEPETLRAALSGDAPRLLAWLATSGDRAIGYASATIDFSTWRARLYLNLDCLFVAPADRGQGVGRALLAAARAHALDRGIDELQWQTPAWNEDAIRFYRRLGASDAPKQRFRLL